MRGKRSIIHRHYDCADFFCRYGPDAVIVSIPLTIIDGEPYREPGLPKCPICGSKMISDEEKDLDKTLYELGIEVEKNE